MVTIEQIRQEIIKAIEQSNMTKSEIAKRIGIKQPTLSQYLSGRAMPSLDTLSKLCSVLDLDANEILCVERENGFS